MHGEFMKYYLLAAAVAAGFAAPAMAQDKAAFTGFHIEALAGYDNVDSGIAGVGKLDGVVYGIGAGYDFAAGGTVIGIEGEATDSTAKTNTIAGKLEAGRDLYIGGRVGAVVGSGLLYVKAGYTNGRLTLKGFGSDNGDGARVGLGYEFAVTGNSFIKVEYRYSNYEQGVSRNQGVAGFGLRF